ncbi:MAG: UDP-3-O-acyl-N-acetylglucosamine deacetylase [Bacteroidales bacterium]|nr:UDP-3-O-acyl-N-acetylglucosamine deacetylase [Bacteroidales bacterium]
MQQKTLGSSCSFEGKGLHTGTLSRIVVNPAPADSGILFRSSVGGGQTIVTPLATKVSSTARSTTISEGEVPVHTIEHLMSALTGMGIDNAIIDINNVEVPILDGSASYYVDAFAKAGIVEQVSARKWIEVPHVIEVSDEKSGSWVRISPADEPSYDITVDFGSKVLGVQKAHYGADTDYAKEIAVCRTFVFFHEIQFLFANNLIKGGDVDNAIVIVERPVTQEEIDAMSASLGKPKLAVTSEGYLNNLSLHYPNECGRHKLLDLIGDLRLCGGFLRAKVEAFKPGHGINTRAAAKIIESLSE